MGLLMCRRERTYANDKRQVIGGLGVQCGGVFHREWFAAKNVVDAPVWCVGRKCEIWWCRMVTGVVGGEVMKSGGICESDQILFSRLGGIIKVAQNEHRCGRAVHGRAG